MELLALPGNLNATANALPKSRNATALPSPMERRYVLYTSMSLTVGLAAGGGMAVEEDFWDCSEMDASSFASVVEVLPAGEVSTGKAILSRRVSVPDRSIS